jgi:hypothetical protein
MTTIRIDLPDQQAATLQAKAEAQGLTLVDWFRKLADAEASPPGPRYTAAELVVQCNLEVSLSAEDRAWLSAPAVGREAL